jgi:hypothetical protein
LVDLHISLIGTDAEDAVMSLQRWLRDDGQIAPGRAEIVAVGSQPGDMGATMDAINMVVSNGIALGGLIVAVATWRSSRAKPPTVRIARGDTVITVEGDSAEEINRTVAALTADASGSVGPGPADQVTTASTSTETPHAQPATTKPATPAVAVVDSSPGWPATEEPVTVKLQPAGPAVAADAVGPANAERLER